MVRNNDLSATNDSKPNQLELAVDSSPKFYDQLFRLDNPGLKVVKSGDAPLTRSGEAEAEAESEETSGSLIEALRQTKPEDLSANLRSMQGLVENFATTDDKVKALAQFRGAFEKTIKSADDDLNTATDTWNKETPKLKPEYQAKTERVKETQEALSKVANTIPDEGKAHMQSVVRLWSMGEQNSPQLQKALESEMGQVKGLPQAVKDSYQAITEAKPIVEKVEKLEAAVKQAEEDRVVSRMIYAEVLDEGGDKNGAKQMQIESMAIQMNVPLEQVKELLNRPEQKKNP
ncbi:hypothetical protein KBI23_25190 [bacterium]|nr:hypothetical protein [bacterium]MBP9808485.1 hypothetical protein [bacterium]